MTIAPVKPGGWALEERLTSAQMNALQAQMVNAIDGVNGGSYAPAGDIVLDGPGKLQIDGTLEVASGGELVVAAGGVLTVQAAGVIVVANNADINVQDGGDLNLLSGADLNVSGGAEIALASGGQINVANGGEVNLASGAEINVANGGKVNVIQGAGISVKSTGRLELLDGAALDLYAGSATSLEGGANINVSGEINILTGGQIDVEDGGDINIALDASINVANGGLIQLSTGAELTVRNATQLRFINAASVGFRLSMLAIPSDPDGWQPHGFGRWIQHDVVSAHHIMFPLLLLPGERIDSLYVRVNGKPAGAPGHVTLPTAKCSAKLISINADGVSSDLGTAATTAGSLATYDDLHYLTFAAITPFTVPTDPVYVQVIGEQGGGAAADTTEIVAILGTSTPFQFRATTEIH